MLDNPALGRCPREDEESRHILHYTDSPYRGQRDGTVSEDTAAKPHNLSSAPGTFMMEGEP